MLPKGIRGATSVDSKGGALHKHAVTPDFIWACLDPRTIWTTRTCGHPGYIPNGSIHGQVWSDLIQALGVYFIIFIL